MDQAREGPFPPEPAIDEEFTKFFDAHYKPLLSFATYWGGNPHDADEALAIVMEYLYRHWTGIRDPVRYARRAVTTTILKIRRDRGDGRYLSTSGSGLPEEASVVHDFDQMAGEQWVDELLAGLPPTQRLVFRRFLDGLSLKEISDELRKSESTIRQNLKLARDRLAPRVREYDRRAAFRSDERTPERRDR